MSTDELAHWGEFIEGISAALTFLAVFIGGVFGLSKYRKQVKISAAEMLLKLEIEFKHIAPICLQIELDQLYKAKLEPLLTKLNSHTDLTDDEAQNAVELDRCLRFFFLLAIFQSLSVEQKAVIRAYYFYLNLLRHKDDRHQLSKYIKNGYPRLSRWLTMNTPAMEEYGNTGRWKPVNSFC
jgi:hypothetical protein